MAKKLDQGQRADQSTQRYLWFGYGNYAGGHPTTQMGGGNIRDPRLLEELLKNTKPWALFVIVGLAGLTIIAMLLAWGITLVLR